MKLPRLAIALAISSLGVVPGCARGPNAPALTAELETPPEPQPEAEADPVAAPDAVDEVEMSVALSEAGMAATIQAPETAAVRAKSSEVEIVGGPDFHLLVGRGAVDPLGEKARIVRRFDGQFRRFLRDDGEVILYETGSAEEQRYHLFMTASVGGHDYHCRTPDDGLPRREAVSHLIDVCASVRFTEDVVAEP